MSFESELRDALRRKPAPAGFTASVMASLDAPPRASRRWAIAKFAAAAMLAVTIGGTWTIHIIEERREGERAKAQLMLALRITSQKLHETQQHLQR